MSRITTTTIVAAVVNEIARAEGEAPEDLPYRLYDHVPFDALEQLVNSAADEWHVTCSIPGHEITVTSENTIIVDDRGPTPLTRGVRTTSNTDHSSPQD